MRTVKATHPDEIVGVRINRAVDEDGSTVVDPGELSYDWVNSNPEAVALIDTGNPAMRQISYLRALEDGSTNLSTVTCTVRNASGRELAIAGETIGVTPGDAVGVEGVSLVFSAIPQDTDIEAPTEPETTAASA